ncbi:hypothetical protein LOTGIDRAFT_153315 [Lottia gigantea]|uniref:Integrase SAM-like N-terminal domain-containing protein n=1 Tax=Lottia gigantea TaxID=225164 RepID=V4AAQ3_LOTGI|nr:hypothetical protein LOTGIDRAFT_153315 [Lottia gigantea]ESO93842.1 hypothetical protein LOTGIDRAFT_153315 [Lottia gigantea]
MENVSEPTGETLTSGKTVQLANENVETPVVVINDMPNIATDVIVASQGSRHPNIPLDVAALEAELQSLQKQRRYLTLQRQISAERKAVNDLEKDEETVPTNIITEPRAVENGFEFTASSTAPVSGGVPREWGLNRLYSTVERLKGKGWANTTRKTYQTHWKTFKDFCRQYALPVFPVKNATIEMYIAYLVDVKHFTYSSIRSYLNIISLLYKSNNLTDPIQSWTVQHLLTGVKRELGAG